MHEIQNDEYTEYGKKKEGTWKCIAVARSLSLERL